MIRLFQRPSPAKCASLGRSSGRVGCARAKRNEQRKKRKKRLQSGQSFSQLPILKQEQRQQQSTTETTDKKAGFGPQEFPPNLTDGHIVHGTSDRQASDSDKAALYKSSRNVPRDWPTMTSHLPRPSQADMATSFDQTAVEPSPLPSSNGLPSYWLNTSHSPDSSRSVYGPEDRQPLDPQVDVAIIGSGITGISAAYHLVNKLPKGGNGASSSSSSQHSIAVFEARDFCSGATGRNGGHCTAVSVLAYNDLASNPDHLARFIQIDSAREEQWGNDRGTKTDETIRRILTLEARTAAEMLMLVRMSKMSRTADCSRSADEDIELVAGCNWHICETADEEKLFDDSIETAKRAGLSDFAMRVKKVPQDEWRDRLNHPKQIIAVYEIPGATLHPRRLVKLIHTLAYTSAQKHNIDLKVFTRTPVQKITPASSQGEMTTLHTDRGDVKARYVIHASNAYASHLLTQYAGPSGILPTRAQCLSISPDESPSKNDALWQMGFSLNEGYEYLQQRPHPEHSGSAPPCVLGGGRWAARNGEWGIADDAAINADVSNVLKPMLSTLFPNNFKASTPPSLEWTGILGYTHSKDPFVGPVTSDLLGSDASATLKEARAGDVVPGQYIAAGYSGHGMTRAYSCAEIVVDMIIQDLKGGKWQPPAWLPLCYLTTFPPSPSSSKSTEQSLSVPHNSEAVPCVSYSLLSSGSNSSGQLSLGHDQDVHDWHHCICIDSQGQSHTFPPMGTRVIGLDSGAGHTVAIVEDVKSLKKSVWGSGENDKGQLGPASQKRLLKFHQIQVSPTLLSPRKAGPFERGAEFSDSWLPNLVATSWESTYISFTSASTSQEGDTKSDDVLLSLGCSNDFGQSGLGSDTSFTSEGPRPLTFPSLGTTYRTAFRIVRLSAGVRHVLLLLTWAEEGASGEERRYALLGFGAGRHGQLGASPNASAPFSTSEGDKVIWQPRILQEWRVLSRTDSSSLLESEQSKLPILTTGRDHSSLLVPSCFVPIPESSLLPRPHDLRDGSKLYLFGSNRVGQCVLPSPKTTDSVGTITSVSTTWNSTLLLQHHSSDAQRNSYNLVGSGRNDKGQLGIRLSDPDSLTTSKDGSESRAALRLSSFTSQDVPKLISGSEHSLLIVRPPQPHNHLASDASLSQPEMYVWGWNEHGNLALGHEEDVFTPTLVWPLPQSQPQPHSAPHLNSQARLELEARKVKNGKVTDAWAGCATSFLQVEHDGGSSQ